MRILLLVALLLPFGLPAAATASDVEPGEQVARSLEVETADGETAEIRYWLFVPADYGTDPMPLLLFLHGAGERGDDLEIVKKWGPPKHVENDADFPFIVVSPQCPAEQRWNTRSLIKLVDHVAGELEVDTSRMYCTGLSMGGYGTWMLATEYPRVFAAVVPICGGGDPDRAERLTGVPVWAFHGDSDRVVPLSRSQDMIEAIRQAGGDQATLTVYPGVGHNSWSETYTNPAVYEWMLQHRRDDDPGNGDESDDGEGRRGT